MEIDQAKRPAGITGEMSANAEADRHAGASDLFSIDKATGEITVADKLTFERGTRYDGKYVVVATVTDPSSNSMIGDDTVVPADFTGMDTVVVAITATDVNEAPVLEGRVELTINEIDSSNEDAVAPDFDGNTGADRTTWTNYYTVSDEDDRSGIRRWDLEGDDKDLFILTQVTGRTLEFKDAPDYENPLDADGDNVYKVTVVAYDNVGLAGKFDVCIAVGNVNEAGTVTFVHANGDPVEQPVSRSPVTAQISDPDGVVEWTVAWQWSKNPNPAAISDNFEDEPFPPSDDGFAESPTDPTYTPNNTDDVAQFLRATATYTGRCRCCGRCGRRPHDVGDNKTCCVGGHGPPSGTRLQSGHHYPGYCGGLTHGDIRRRSVTHGHRPGRHG